MIWDRINLLQRRKLIYAIQSHAPSYGVTCQP